ncbi:MAG TPA: hypothetical protein VGZ32_10530 [Actinocrinis sp.]|jgi:hypothetical protein|nr:hypothetical protein [Actinocrinis sp.]
MAAEAREAGDEKAVAYWEHIAELVDKCPPLTDRQIVELRAIFASAAPRVIATTRQPGRAPDGEA